MAFNLGPDGIIHSNGTYQLIEEGNNSEELYLFSNSMHMQHYNAGSGSVQIRPSYNFGGSNVHRCMGILFVHANTTANNVACNGMYHLWAQYSNSGYVNTIYEQGSQVGSVRPSWSHPYFTVTSVHDECRVWLYSYGGYHIEIVD